MGVTEVLTQTKSRVKDRQVTHDGKGQAAKQQSCNLIQTEGSKGYSPPNYAQGKQHCYKNQANDLIGYEFNIRNWYADKF